MLVFEDASIAIISITIPFGCHTWIISWTNAEVKHVLNSAEKKLWFKLGFWNLTVPIDHPHPTYVQKVKHPTTEPPLSPVCFNKSRRFRNRGKVFVCFEDELCRILVAHLSRPPRSDIKSLWRTVGKTSMALGEKPETERWGIQTSEKTWALGYPPESISQMQLPCLVCWFLSWSELPKFGGEGWCLVIAASRFVSVITDLSLGFPNKLQLTIHHRTNEIGGNNTETRKHLPIIPSGFLLQTELKNWGSSCGR